MDSHHKKALTLALREIDSKPDQFVTREQQNALLQELIQSHNLKATEKGKGKDSIPNKLTVAQYRQKLENVAAKYGAPQQTDVPRATSIFQNGSAVVRAAYLAKLGWSEQAAADTNSGGGHDQGNAAGEKSGELKTAQLSRNGAPTKPDIPDNIIRDMTGASSAGSQLRFEEGPAGPGPMSRGDSSNASKKRKGPVTDEDDNRVRKQSKAAEWTDSGTATFASDQSPPNDRNAHKRPASDITNDRDAKRQKVASEDRLQTAAETSQLQGAREPVSDTQSAEQPRQSANGEAARLMQSPAGGFGRAGNESAIENRDGAAVPPAAGTGPSSTKRKTPDSEVPAAASKRQRMEDENPRPRYEPPHHTDRYGLTDWQEYKRVKLVDYELIRNHIGGLEMWSQGFAVHVTEDMGVPIDRTAEWIANPSAELADLYRLVFGNDWKESAFLAGQAQDFSAFELIDALVTAEWYKIAFLEKSPWPGPRELTAAMEHLEEYFDLYNSFSSK